MKNSSVQPGQVFTGCDVRLKEWFEEDSWKASTTQTNIRNLNLKMEDTMDVQSDIQLNLVLI
jgi:murein endopeptidase